MKFPGKIYGYLLGLTIIFGVLPFALYYYQISTGILPDPDTWTGNHGPWRYGIENLITFYPLLAIYIISSCAWFGFMNKSNYIWWTCLWIILIVLMVLQFSLLVGMTN